MPLSNVSSDRFYTDLMNGTSGKDPIKNFDAIFTKGGNTNLGMSDFLILMIAQLTNQDFTNPVNDTEYVAQMAQFSTLSAMQELSQLSRQSYVLSLLGKNCTVSENLIGGDVKTVTGKVTSISLVDDDYKVTINGKQYGMSEITSVSEATEEK